MFAGEGEMLHITLEIERQIEREAETGLLDQLLDTVRAGGRATCGIAPTLQALDIGLVHTLVVSDGLHPEGSEVVHDEAARRLQERCGGLGARLPFR